MDSPRGLLLLPTLLCFLCLVTAAPQGDPASHPTVQSRHGLLQGLRVTVKGTDRGVNAYLGVPFARPPTGPRRFAAPEPAQSWDGLRNATTHPPICLQPIRMSKLIKQELNAEFPILPVSEDCLYLNVYTPAEADKNSKLPVMVWIHGGGLAVGSASQTPGSALAAYENVVVVCIQYRLGILGFLSTGDEHARGNWGFLDQVAALEWVKHSIEAFGGDPGSVTIFGESAGGFSTSAHVLSPLSKGLFHKAISESGVLVYSGTVIAELQAAVETAKTLANISGCDTTDSSTILKCLRQKPEEHFLGSEIEQRVSHVPGVVDGHFLPKSPLQLLEEKQINAVPHLIGCNNQEFGYLMPKFFQLSDLQKGLDRETVETAMKRGLGNFLGPKPEYQPQIFDEYLGNVTDPFQLRDNFLDIFGDIVFVIQSILRARYHRDAGLPIYLYEYQHRPTMFKDLRPAYVKADHGDEIPFVFGSPFMDADGKFTAEEEVLSKTIMKYWVNFARNGHPNGAGLVEWPVYDRDERYLQINLSQKVSSKWKDNRVIFWTQILPRSTEEAKKLQKVN